jgi:hypothetical protein
MKAKRRAALSPGCKQPSNVQLDAIDFSGTLVACRSFRTRHQGYEDCPRPRMTESEKDL